MRVRGIGYLYVAGALSLAGCANTIQQAELQGFADAAGAVEGQADTAFNQANKITRQTAIDRFVSSGAPGLTEEPFKPAIDPATAEAWSDALLDLERYGVLLSSLVDGDRGAATAGAITQLGQELGSGVAGARINPSVGAAFSTFAGILVDASAQRSARAIMTKTDPAVRSLLNTMADAVGRERQTGLRGTVLSNWTTSLNSTRAAYAQAAVKGDEVRKRALIGEYLNALDRREADLRALAALSASLSALADAHSAAAAGSAIGRKAALERIERRIDQTRRAFETLEKVEAR